MLIFIYIKNTVWRLQEYYTPLYAWSVLQNNLFLHLYLASKGDLLFPKHKPEETKHNLF